MVIVRKVGQDSIEGFSTLNQVVESYPEFSLSYLQNKNLGLDPFVYKGYFIYRVRRSLINKKEKRRKDAGADL